MANPARAKKVVETHPLVRLGIAVGGVLAGLLGGLELLKIFKGQ